MTSPAPAPSLGRLFGLAWPIIVSRSTQSVVGLSDALMVAWLGSKDATAAATGGAFNTYAVLILPMGVVFIVSSFSSQLFGRGDVAGARRYGWYGLAVALLAQGLGLALMPAIPSVLGWFDYSPGVHALMTTYLLWRLPSVGAAIGLEALANYYGGLGNTRLPMIASVLAMVLNVFGNWVLIFGELGFPEMGVAGAALASALSTVVGFLFLFGRFLADGRGLPKLALSMVELRRMLRFGIPSGFNWFFEFFAFNLFINVVMAGLGTAAYAAFMLVLQINSVSFMPSFGLASAGAILVGQSIGAGKKDDVPRVVRLTLASAAGWQGFVGLLYLVVPAFIFSPFAKGEDRAALMDFGVRMLMLSAAWQIFDATVNTFAEALRGTGDTAFVLWSRAVIAWGLFFPGSYLAVRVLGGSDVVAMWWVVAYMGLLTGALWWRFRTGAWRRIELVEPTLVA